MLATTSVVVAPMMSASPPEYPLGQLKGGLASQQRQFKRHKILPRPQGDRGLDYSRSVSVPTKLDLTIDTAPCQHLSFSQPSSPRALKHESRRIGAGPDLPPTPPGHPGNSSSSHSALPSSPTIADSGFQTPRHASRRPIATPPDQRSPPTPDVTPPGPSSRAKALRPCGPDRGASRTTVADSRTESFKTAREEPSTSEDEGSRTTPRPTMDSATTSRTTVLQVPDAKRTRAVQPQDLDLALGRLNVAPTDTYTPRTRGEFGKFDGDWDSPRDARQDWDDTSNRVDGMKKSRPGAGSLEGLQENRHDRVFEDNIVRPTNATKAVREVSLREAAALSSSPRRSSDRSRGPPGPSKSEPTVPTDTRRLSGHSSNSHPSAVVEAILVGAPPQRQRTLRHVRKQRTLREPSISLPGSSVKEAIMEQPNRHLAAKQRPEDRRRHESYSSTSGTNSIASARARREVWKNGGIPVVVVPDRRSSSKARSSKEPSLRSTSSRRSKRASSVDSEPREVPPSKETGPVFERRAPRGRTRTPSRPEPLEQRTLDNPPTVPARTSSLSAPTSRNASRAGSLTAQSLRALDNLQHAPTPPAEPTVTRGPELEGAIMPEMGPRSPTASISSPLERDDAHDFLSLSRHDDAASSKRFSSRNTPFSIASFETTGTAPELSEALAIHLYPHQNSSVLVVNHSAKPSESSDTSSKEAEIKEPLGPPMITTMSPDGGPVTPPQQAGSSVEVDSPLRNPRPPPQPPTHPPAINFIPATPSGLTPADEKHVQLGDYDDTAGEKPRRYHSIVRRALSRRRHSISYPPSASKAPGFLTRTFSLSRNARYTSAAASGKRSYQDEDSSHPHQEETPAERDKLHPFWRPQWSDDDVFECDGSCCHSEYEADDEIYKYPPVDNRPRSPKRSLSARMKRTFAIMPIRDDEYYSVDDSHGPERRTIRRTSSGNLRVMRRRASAESFEKHQGMRRRPSSEGMRQRFWRSHSLRQRSSKDKVRRSSISSRLEGIQDLPRRLSERRREKRSRELRQMISGPTAVRDGVQDVIKPMSAKNREHPSNALI